MAKTRVQILQEGKCFSGLGFQKGYHWTNVVQDTMNAGGGMKKFYSSWDAFALRTMTYTTARIWGFLYFYDWINPDARRQAKGDFYALAGLCGGFAGGMLSNPFQVVFNRMQVDELYPERARRNYKGFIDGFIKTAEEGALFRGSAAYSMKLAALVSVATGFYDTTKEYMFYFFGPIHANRIVGTGIGAFVALLASMPFDTVATRMHTMRPLPNGEMPYRNSLDCFTKIWKYECNFEVHLSNFGAFYSGGQAYFLRLYLIAVGSQYLLDYYHGSAKVSEFWQPARFHYQSGIDYDIHNPYTDGFNNYMVHNWKSKENWQAFHPEGGSGKKDVVVL